MFVCFDVVCCLFVETDPLSRGFLWNMCLCHGVCSGAAVTIYTYDEYVESCQTKRERKEVYDKTGTDVSG